jgi:hypothetical protein
MKNTNKDIKNKDFKDFHFRLPKKIASLFVDEAEKEGRSCVSQLRRILEERYNKA